MRTPSLLDRDDFSNVGRTNTGRGAPVHPAGITKIGVAATLLLAAGALICWHFGLVGANHGVANVNPDQAGAREEIMKADEAELDRLQRDSKIIPGDS